MVSNLSYLYLVWDSRLPVARFFLTDTFKFSQKNAFVTFEILHILQQHLCHRKYCSLQYNFLDIELN